MEEKDWNKTATNLIKAEIARAGIGYEELVNKLSEIGVTESYTGISAKINRGTFSFAFFLQCMKAINLQTFRIEG